MKDNKIDKIIGIAKKEARILLFVFILNLIIFKICFYKEILFIIIKLIFSIWWLFIIPGYFIMFNYKEDISFLERFFFGIVLGMIVYAIFSYPLGLLGVHIKYHVFIIPLTEIIFSALVFFYKKHSLLI